MSERKIEFNSRFKDMFKDYDGPDDEPLSYEDELPEFDGGKMLQFAALKNPELLYLARYYLFLRRRKSRYFLLEFARYLYETERS